MQAGQSPAWMELTSTYACPTWHKHHLTIVPHPLAASSNLTTALPFYLVRRNDSTEPADQQYLDTAAGVDNGIDEVQEADERTTSQAAVSTPAATPVAGAAVPIIAEMPVAAAVAAATAAAEVAAAAVDSVGTSTPSSSTSSNSASSAPRGAAPAAAATAAAAAAAPQASAGPTSHPIAIEEDFFGAQASGAWLS